jgi:hypothetical protein
MHKYDMLDYAWHFCFYKDYSKLEAKLEQDEDDYDMPDEEAATLDTSNKSKLLLKGRLQKNTAIEPLPNLAAAKGFRVMKKMLTLPA